MISTFNSDIDCKMSNRNFREKIDAKYKLLINYTEPQTPNTYLAVRRF